jgi:DNA-binding IclR family transcriptional regulator
VAASTPASPLRSATVPQQRAISPRKFFNSASSVWCTVTTPSPLNADLAKIRAVSAVWLAAMLVWPALPRLISTCLAAACKDLPAALSAKAVSSRLSAPRSKSSGSRSRSAAQALAAITSSTRTRPS